MQLGPQSHNLDVLLGPNSRMVLWLWGPNYTVRSPKLFWDLIPEWHYGFGDS